GDIVTRAPAPSPPRRARLAGGFEAEPATVDVGELAQRDAGDLAVAAEGEGGEARVAEERIEDGLRRDERVAAAGYQQDLQLLRPRDQPALLAIDFHTQVAVDRIGERPDVSRERLRGRRFGHRVGEGRLRGLLLVRPRLMEQGAPVLLRVAALQV